MIKKIIMNQATCFKQPAVLETDKKINLIYGLNGTGKSSLSDYLYNLQNPLYVECSIEGLADENVLVYNQSFIREYFYQDDNLPGIFTLSKQNKTAEEEITKANNEITRLLQDKMEKDSVLHRETSAFSSKKQAAENTIWAIKNMYAGGDRVLEYCLDNLKGKKETLFNHLLNIDKPISQPPKTITQLKNEVSAIRGTTAQKYELLPKIEVKVGQIENHEIFKRPIVGNENSSIGGLIRKLGNSDWVKEGLEYVSIDEKSKVCPFCQQQTMTPLFIENIRNYFDETYEKDIEEIKILGSTYQSNIEIIPNKVVYDLNPFLLERKPLFENLYGSVSKCFIDNRDKIREKLKTPSQNITLLDSKKEILELNSFIDEINNEIIKHNDRIDNIQETLDTIKQQFWECMRWEYDQTISAFLTDKTNIEKKTKDLTKQIQKVDDDIKSQRTVIAEQQKNTINIDGAISNINNGLIELGIDGFSINKHSDVLYKIVRNEQSDNTFETLSEGEKMIISFLYFRELCKGKKSRESSSTNKIVVIDDPISSLSHIYVFNVGQMIRNDFFNSNYEQLFLMTHSLYFFYEMTYTNHDKRRDEQKLFRLSKNSEGSQFYEMKYEDIQNDYQAYWSIIKDDKQTPALIANCMRNIIEYFFGFIEKKDVNNTFQKPVLKKTKFQAFCRYINRESHSIGQNIFDIKEFNYEDFKEAFRLIFVENGYETHYTNMMK